MILPILLLCIAVINLSLRYLRLRKLPGPFFCHFTDLPRAIAQNRGRLTDWLANVHQEYGTVVRIGPNTVSVSDATKVPAIYTMHGEFTKADSYHPLRTFSKGVSKGSIIDMQDEKMNADLKRALRGAFSARNVLEYDEEVDKQILALKKRILEDGTVPLMELLAEYQMDFFMKMAFGEISNFMEQRMPTKQFSFIPRARHWHRFQGLPKLEEFLFQNRIANIFMGKQKPSAWSSYASAAIKARMESTRAGGKTDDQKNDLLDKYIQARQTHAHLFDDEALNRMVSSTVSAGFDTTPFTMNNMLFYLCKNPPAYAKLKQEIMDAHHQGKLSEVPKWNEVNKLPYLDAVMKEAMRLYPFLNLPLERNVPADGLNIDGFHLPAQTVVGCHATIVGRDRAFYGKDADEFRPERWIEGDRVAMERNSLVFGNGKRICLGMHIAELEIKKTIPVIVRDFDMKLVNPMAQLISEDGFSSMPKSVAVIFESRKE